MAEDVDKEIEAIKAILAALTPLEPATRSVVLEYVFKRLKFTASHLALSPSPAETRDGLGPTSRVGGAAAIAHIKELKLAKKPRSANEMAALVAYYLANMAPEQERKQSVNTKDIETYFKIADFRLPEQIRVTLQNAKNAGYFDSASDGEYRLNAVGHNLVVHSMPRGADSGGSARPRRRGKSRKSKP